MGRFQLELIYLYFPPSSQDRNIHILDGTTVENKDKLILTYFYVTNYIYHLHECYRVGYIKGVGSITVISDYENYGFGIHIFYCFAMSPIGMLRVHSKGNGNVIIHLDSFEKYGLLLILIFYYKESLPIHTIRVIGPTCTIIMHGTQIFTTSHSLHNACLISYSVSRSIIYPSFSSRLVVCLLNYSKS